jgi:sterol desaturase/sphingolipid hydroxylase (fatty acid hydroxylase superfamily)
VSLIDFRPLLLTALVFVSLERLVARRPNQQVFRRGWTIDVTHVFLTGLLVKLGYFLVVLLAFLTTRQLVPSAWRATIASQPLWLQFPMGLVIADFGFYWAHRAFHSFPTLWRFHAVHHSIEEMDWLAAHRVHPVDQILTKGASLLLIDALGFSTPATLLLATFYQWQSLLIHSNVRIGFGPLEWILASPRFHHWHHANCPEAINKNFAGQLVFLDHLFGTLHMPIDRMPARYGTDDAIPRSYLGQITYPLLPKRASR